MAYRGFTIYNDACYCWYDDGLVPSNFGGQVTSIWSGVGPVATILARSGASCYKSIHTIPPTLVPSPKPSQNPTVRVSTSLHIISCREQHIDIVRMNLS